MLDISTGMIDVEGKYFINPYQAYFIYEGEGKFGRVFKPVEFQALED
jgi:hypothetical protein